MFHSARIKLTAWYLTIIMAISLSFSAVIYHVLSEEVHRLAQVQRFRIERRLRDRGYLPTQPPGQMQSPFLPTLEMELVNDSTHRILLSLFFVNSAILVLSGGLGYLLAGRTLRPIHTMLEEQNRFVSDASHELRTPLTALKSSLEVGLRDANLSLPEAKKLMQDSVRDVNRLQLLSESLLMLSQHQNGNGKTVKKLNIKEIILEAVAKIKPIALSKEITLVASPPTIDMYGDRFALIELFVILLDNAVKYSNNGSKVIVSVKKTNDLVTILVKDTGIGIPQKDLPHVFDRFYRGDRARSKIASGGYGLGLSIAKKIVETHNGSISVISTLKKGSTFSVRLPVIKSS